jgi:hypothetical protein
MIIRHAEKPDEKHAGVNPDGKSDHDDLTVKGWQRAGALARFFNPYDYMFRIGIHAPDHLFACNNSKRPKHTIKALAKIMDLPINDRLAHTDVDRLSKAVKEKCGNILICWEHNYIRPMVSLITEGQIIAPEWPDNRFDMVFVLVNEQGNWRLTQVAQLLMPNDSLEWIGHDSKKGMHP